MSNKPHPEEESEGAEGGHAAERLEEFLSERFPGGVPPEERPFEKPPEECEPTTDGEAKSEDSVMDESA